MNSQIEAWFTYHAPNDAQLGKYEILRRQAKDLAYTINTFCPDSADKTAAMRKLRECIMTANAAIAIGG
jgi:hypothetical protein